MVGVCVWWWWVVSFFWNQHTSAITKNMEDLQKNIIFSIFSPASNPKSTYLLLRLLHRLTCGTHSTHQTNNQHHHPHTHTMHTCQQCTPPPNAHPDTVGPMTIPEPLLCPNFVFYSLAHSYWCQAKRWVRHIMTQGHKALGIIAWQRLVKKCQNFLAAIYERSSEASWILPPWF